MSEPTESAATESAQTTRIWTDSRFLQHTQYSGPANLAARQSLYANQYPRVRIYRWALGFAELSGDEVVVDVGCGNGGYLGALREMEHRGLTLGIDLSAGMLASVASTVPGQPLAQADAASLPLRDSSADVCMAMHMLYHVPEPRLAVAELRRVVRHDGVVLVVLNRAGHTIEMRHLIEEAQRRAGHAPHFPYIGRVLVPEGLVMLEEVFGSVEVHEVDSTLRITDPEAVVGYAASVNLAELERIDPEPVYAEIRRLVAEHVAEHGVFEVSSATGCIVARP